MLRVVVPLASAAAGSCWLVALFLPWATAGTLSSASLIDAVELVRRGAAESVVPRSAAAVVLLPALAGAVLVGVVGFAGRTATALRIVALVIGSLGSLGLGWRLTGLDASAAGVGAWIAGAGVLAAVVAAVVLVLGRPRLP